MLLTEAETIRLTLHALSLKPVTARARGTYDAVGVEVIVVT